MGIPKRYILVICTHIGFFIVYSLRVNLSSAMVAMVARDANKTNQHGNHARHNHQVIFLFFVANIFIAEKYEEWNMEQLKLHAKIMQV